jgi:hypothetical protein
MWTAYLFEVVQQSRPKVGMLLCTLGTHIVHAIQHLQETDLKSDCCSKAMAPAG